MSRIMSYAVLAILALGIGGFSFWLVNRHAGPIVERSFAIEGMHCPGCALNMTSALKEIPGVQSATVSFQDRRAVVLASESNVPTPKILEAIEAAGYKGQIATTQRSAAATAASGSASPTEKNH